MSTQIRIIKRSEREAARKSAQQQKKKQQQHRVPEAAGTRQAARDITGHVATWIKELQQRHTPDPRRAFANLFVDPATSQAD